MINEIIKLIKTTFQLMTSIIFSDPHMIGIESLSNSLTGQNSKTSEILNFSLIAASHLHIHE